VAAVFLGTAQHPESLVESGGHVIHGHRSELSGGQLESQWELIE
jgi:hypothetical protein